jgi:diguanylate cyclase (GGDEF)-like protein
MLGNIAGYQFIKKRNLLESKYITYISILPFVFFLTWSVIITFVNPLSNNVIISYMIGLLVFGTIPLLRPIVSILTILGSYLLYVILLNSRNYDVYQYFVDSSIFVSCAIIASVALYRQKAKDFQSKRTIIAQNKELFKLNAELQTRSITDSLTSYYNRYYLDSLSEKCNVNIQNNIIVGVLMADIDNFKSYNDHFNHIEGDRCLVTISEAIKKVIAPYTDNIFRYGGEEFLIVFYNLSKVVIEKIAEEMRQTVDNLQIKNPGLNPVANITISIGGSVTNENETRTFEQLIYDADTALYNAKNLGKNSCLFI